MLKSATFLLAPGNTSSPSALLGVTSSARRTSLMRSVTIHVHKHGNPDNNRVIQKVSMSENAAILLARAIKQETLQKHSRVASVIIEGHDRNRIVVEAAGDHSVSLQFYANEEPRYVGILERDAALLFAQAVELEA